MSFAALLQESDRLYEAALGLQLEQFETFALRRLGQVVGFDGMVWGHGHREGEPAAVVIDQAVLIDRPDELVRGYAEIARDDPIARAFLSAPYLPVMETVASPRRYLLPSQAQSFLLGFDVGHLVLCGRPMGDDVTVRWLTAYRQPQDRPFTPDDVRLLWSLLPLWNQAWEVCRIRNRLPIARSGWSEASPSRPFAPGLRSPLTPRQAAVLQELSQGLRYAEIASRLGLSLDTVRSHIRVIYQRLGVRNRTEALIVAASSAAEQYTPPD